MPGRGFATALLLILIALGCLAGVRRIERDRRLIAKLRAHGAVDLDGGLPLDRLSPDERDGAEMLSRAGVVSIQGNRCFTVQSQLSMFRRKRMRATLSAAFVALVLAVLVSILILRR